jgi:hypothetical protein
MDTWGTQHPAPARHPAAAHTTEAAAALASTMPTRALRGEPETRGAVPIEGLGHRCHCPVRG